MDATNAGTPTAGGQLSGEVTRAAAIRRLQQQQSVNTGSSGVPKPPPVPAGKRKRGY